jgi:hypothetical protein
LRARRSDPAAIEAVEELQQHAFAAAVAMQRKPRKHLQYRQRLKPQLRAPVPAPATSAADCFLVLLDSEMDSTRMKYIGACRLFTATNTFE